MDKIISINLGGFSIKIDEDAYESLKRYINLIERKYSETENGKEIINDIEARIAELLLENLKGKVASNLADVEFIIKNMGNPDEFDQSNENQQSKEQKHYSEEIPKRFYRDSDDKMLGGVCSGISKYFDIDPTIVRIIWICLVMFFGTGILVYLILWLIVPEAVTTAQKLEMNGKAPTMENIINKVKSEAENVGKNIKSQNIGKKLNDIFKSISPVFVVFFKAIAVFFGIILLVFFSLLIVSLVSGTGSIVVNSSGIFSRQIPNVFDASWEFLSVKVLVGLFIGIPLFNIITMLLKFAFNSDVNYRPVRRVLSIIWFFTIPLLIYFAYLGIKNFKNLETNTRETTEIISSNLLIKSVIENEEYYGTTSYKIENSNDSFIHIIIKETASGENKNKALLNASKIGAAYEFSNNTLTLKKSDYYQKTGIFRRQKTEFLILVPNNINFTLSPEIQKQNVYVKGSNIVYFTNKNKPMKNELLFLGSKLFCPSCTDSLPNSANSEDINENFDKVEVEGWMDIEIVKGNVFNIQKNGEDHIIDNIETEISGSVLLIKLNDRFINIGNKPKIIITMPYLTEIKLSGANECKIDDFSGKSINIELSGASSAILNLNYENADIDLSGVSKIDISGKISKISYNCAGAASINSQNLVAESVNIDIAGASQIVVGKTNSIVGDASGACKIEYTGKPFYDVKTSGLCKVKHY